MTAEVRVFIPGIPTRPNDLRTQHWGRRAEEHKGARRSAELATRDAINRSRYLGPLPIDPAVVRMTFVLRRAMGDLDNLVAASKPYLDGVVDAKLLADDSVSHVRGLVVGWIRGTRPGVFVTVSRFEELGR